MNIALASLNQHWEDKERNFLKCKEIAVAAKKNASELLIFPELTLTSFSLNPLSIAEDENSSETIKRFTKLAVEIDINIVFGACINTKKDR